METARRSSVVVSYDNCSLAPLERVEDHDESGRSCWHSALPLEWSGKGSGLLLSYDNKRPLRTLLVTTDPADNGITAKPDRKKLIRIALVCGALGFLLAFPWRYFFDQQSGSTRSSKLPSPNTAKSNGHAPTSHAFYSLSHDDKLLGIFIYPSAGQCPEIREREPRILVMVSSPNYIGRGNIERKELAQCFNLDVQNPNVPVSTHCVDGFVCLERASAANTIAVEYSFTFQDGSNKSGKLSAVFCPKSIK